jgi:hypothetical protein
MKKKTKIIIISVVVLLVLIAAVPFVILYTAPGNYLISPFVESEINKHSPLKITLKKFRLYPGYIIISADVAGGAVVDAEGTYSLFDQSFNIDYKVNAGNLSVFSEIAEHPLQGTFSTQGKAEGTKNDFNVTGSTDFADSDTKYSLNIKNLKLDSVNVESLHFHPEAALYTAVMPELVNGALDLSLNLKLPEKIDAKFKFRDGKLNSEVIAEEFDVDIPGNPAVRFDGNIVKINSSLDYDINLDSEPASVILSGTFDDMAEKVNGKYDIKIKELALLEPFIKQKLRGPLSAEGDISGTPDNITVKGTADIAGGTASYSLLALNTKIRNLEFNLKNSSLARLFHMICKPVYADAVLSVDGKFSSLEPENIQGTVHTELQDGKTLPDVLLEEFKLHDALITFNLNADTVIENSTAVTKLKFKSDVADIYAEKAEYNIPAKRLNSDFKIDIQNLDNLYFLTDRHLNGNMVITGDIVKDNKLEVNAHSETLGGNIDANLSDKDLTVYFKSLNTTDICRTLIYPEIFKSQINSVIKYNLTDKGGTVEMEMLDGALTRNSFTDIIRDVSKFDITTEIYKKTTVSGIIENSVFTGDLNMKSNLTRISSKKAVFDLKRNKIKAAVRIEVKKKAFTVNLKGDVREPSISVDASEYISSELEKVIDKKIPEKHKKTIKAILDIFK